MVGPTHTHYARRAQACKSIIHSPYDRGAGLRGMACHIIAHTTYPGAFPRLPTAKLRTLKRSYYLVFTRATGQRYEGKDE